MSEIFRAEQAKQALFDEIDRFNETVRERRVTGNPLRVPDGPSLCKGAPIRYMNKGMWLFTGPEWTGNSWACCNDSFWAELLAHAGVERHPLFAKHTWKGA